MRILLPLLLLTGCAGAVANVPSLLPRPIESRSDDEPVVTPAPAVADPALDHQIAERVAAFETAAQAFAASETSTEALVARAGSAPEGSDAWLNAQTAVSVLGNVRAATDAAVADLEALGIARSEVGAYPALDAAIARASAEADRENEVTTRMSQRLVR